MVGVGGGDSLSGGDGGDDFRYNAKTDGIDSIVDFAHGEDVLDFDHTGFGNHLARRNAETGALDPNQFAATSDGHATAARAQFLYNTTDGTLSFDADGTGHSAAIKIAVLGVGANLSSADIHLV